MSSQCSFTSGSRVSSSGSPRERPKRRETAGCTHPKCQKTRFMVEELDRARAAVSSRVGYQPSLRGRLCPSLSSSGLCDNLNECPYSHTVEETRVYNPQFKTKICEFAANGFCSRANLCRYAHSYSELKRAHSDGELQRANVSDCPSMGRNVSSVSTSESFGIDCQTPEPHNYGCGSEATELSPIVSESVGSPTTRVCYVAPETQRSVLHQRQQQRRRGKMIAIPSAFHYVEQLERMRVPPMPFAYVPYHHPSYPAEPVMVPYGHPQYYANQMVYSMTPYED
jgi:hypothetical protein